MKFPSAIEKRLDLNFDRDSKIGDGWIPIIKNLDKKLDMLIPEYTIQCIKEKLGGLRYYIDYSADSSAPKILNDVCSIINEAYLKSTKTCELCGKPGKILKIDWLLVTRCEVHKDEL